MTPQTDIQNILDASRQGKKIELIKMFRQVSGKGLKDSKDEIEACEDPTSRRYNEYRLIDAFYKASGGDRRFRPHVYEPEFYDKEKFLNDISEAIEAGRKMRSYDMLDAVITFCENIRDQGGIEELAREREEFIDSI